MNFLNKKIFDFSDSAFGLDLSDLSVKVVQLKRKSKGDEVRSFGSADIPLGIISDGEIIKKEIVVEKIKEAIQKAGPKKINSKKVICSLPETKAFLRLINIPKMEEEEIREAIKWEVEANIPLKLDQVYYDWQLLDKNLSADKNKKSVLIIAVAKSVANQFLEIIEQVGLDPVGLEIESIAQIHSLIKDGASKETTLLVDLGDRRTSFLVAVGDTPCFSSSVPISASLLTDSLSKTLNLVFKEAEKIKLNYGIGSFVKKDPIFRAEKPVLDNLIFEIKKSTNFYLTELKYSSSIDQVILCGGGALTKGIVTYLSKELEQEVSIGDPWVNLDMKNKVPIIKKDKSVQYSTAIGLALKGLNYEELS